MATAGIGTVIGRPCSIVVVRPGGQGRAPACGGPWRGSQQRCATVSIVAQKKPKAAATSYATGRSDQLRQVAATSYARSSRTERGRSGQ